MCSAQQQRKPASAAQHTARRCTGPQQLEGAQLLALLAGPLYSSINHRHHQGAAAAGAGVAQQPGAHAHNSNSAMMYSSWRCPPTCCGPPQQPALLLCIAATHRHLDTLLSAP